MRHRLSLVSFLCISLFIITGLSAVTVTVGTGTGTTDQMPISAASRYSYTQQIYTKSQIGQPLGGFITSLSFHCSSYTSFNNSNSWAIYMGNTSKANFSSTTDWVAVANLTQVFNGNVTFVSGGWMTINLTTPFYYDNVANLLIAVDENTSGNAGGSRTFSAFTSTANTGIYRYANNNINPSSPGTATGRTNIINRIMFNMDLAIGDPSSVTATAIDETQINLNWTKNASNNNVMVAYSLGGSVGTPADGTQYAVNDNIPGGGTVIYNGSGTNFNHTALYPNTTYYIITRYGLWGMMGPKLLSIPRA